MKIIVIYVLSKIWKSGAKIEREKDGSLRLHHHELIDDQTLKSANVIFDDIDNYLKTVEGMSPVDLTNWKVIMHMCGWLHNDSANDFLNNDEQAGPLAFDFQAKLAVNGWTNVYDDYRQFESSESEKLKIEIYNRAIAFAKGAK